MLFYLFHISNDFADVHAAGELPCVIMLSFENYELGTGLGQSEYPGLFMSHTGPNDPGFNTLQYSSHIVLL